MTGKPVECHVTENGVCGMHGVVVERRQSDRADIDEMAKKMPFLLSSVNRLLALSGLLVLVMGGSFIYTRDVSQTQTFHERAAKGEFDKINDTINSLKVISTRDNERYLAVLRELETLNKQMAVIIDQQVKWIDTAKQKEKK